VMRVSDANTFWRFSGAFGTVAARIESDACDYALEPKVLTAYTLNLYRRSVIILALILYWVTNPVLASISVYVAPFVAKSLSTL